MRIPLGVALLMTHCLSGIASGQTADEIIAKNLGARGGIEKMRAIHSMVVTARLATPDGGGGPLTVRLLRPNLIREVMAFGPTKSIHAFDGQSAWALERDTNHEDLRPLTGGDLENLRDEAENGIGGALADYASKGNHVKLEGAAVVEGKTCYKLKVTLRSGHVQFQYLDTKTFLEIHEEIARTFNGQDSLIEQTVGDYRSEGGILFAHSFISGLAGRPQRSRLTIEKIELNAPVDKALFQMPKPAGSGSAAPQPSFLPAALPGKKGSATRSA